MADKIFKVILENPNRVIESNEETGMVKITENIKYLIASNNIVPVTDHDKLYFVNKDTLEVVSEFYRVK